MKIACDTALVGQHHSYLELPMVAVEEQGTNYGGGLRAH